MSDPTMKDVFEKLKPCERHIAEAQEVDVKDTSSWCVTITGIVIVLIIFIVSEVL